MTSRTRERSVGLRRKAATLASVIALIALVVGSLFGDRGILQLIAQRERAEALPARSRSCARENARLAARDRAPCARDPRAIERLAREELGPGPAGRDGVPDPRGRRAPRR